MKTKIEEFWDYFLAVQLDLLEATGEVELMRRENMMAVLYSKATSIDPKLAVLLMFPNDGSYLAKLAFVTWGIPRLKALADELLAEAPLLYSWELSVGVKPYRLSVIHLCEDYKFFERPTTIYQIYFAVERIYKTSNKLHLVLYIQMDQRYSKADIHSAMYEILLCYLGDFLFHKHISRFRIVRRKYSAINFIPLDELKNLIHYKSIN